MGDQYFQFKQFRIEQGRCAMKVTTDACIQGAWIPVFHGAGRVLDIGAGTGILSLMLAQRNPDITIDCIELDSMAAGQARDNANASLWKERINVLNGDARDFISPVKYDLIITNPPFFNNSLLSDMAAKNTARHTLSLSYRDLLNAISNNLREDGCASVLLPYTEYFQWKVMLDEAQWFECDKLFIQHTEKSQIKRVVTMFSKKKCSEIEEQTLVIKDNEQNYTPGFKRLLSPFYLYL